MPRPAFAGRGARMCGRVLLVAPPVFRARKLRLPANPGDLDSRAAVSRSAPWLSDPSGALPPAAPVCGEWPRPRRFQWALQHRPQASLPSPMRRRPVGPVCGPALPMCLGVASRLLAVGCVNTRVGSTPPDGVDSSDATGRLFGRRASFTPIETLRLLARASTRWLVLNGVTRPGGV